MLKSKKVDLAQFSRSDPWWKTTLWGKEYIAYEVVILITAMTLIIGIMTGFFLSDYVHNKNVSKAAASAQVVIKSTNEMAETGELGYPIRVPQINFDYLVDEQNYLVPDITKSDAER